MFVSLRDGCVAISAVIAPDERIDRKPPLAESPRRLAGCPIRPLYKRRGRDGTLHPRPRDGMGRGRDGGTLKGEAPNQTLRPTDRRRVAKRSDESPKATCFRSCDAGGPQEVADVKEGASRRMIHGPVGESALTAQ